MWWGWCGGGGGGVRWPIESSTRCNFRKHMQIEKAPANQENIFISLTAGARFNKEVQPTLSLNLNSELTYSEMGNSEFSVTEQLNCVSLLNSK